MAVTWPPPQEIEMPKTIKLRFLRGKTYQGQTFGPDQPDGEVGELEERWARRFIAQGVAEEVTTSSGKAKTRKK